VEPDAGTRGEPAYVEQANKAQLLLEQGDIGQAFEVFQAALAALPSEPSYAHAVLSERLGRCLLMAAKPTAAMALFRQAIGITHKITATHGTKALRGMLQSSLGDAYRSAGQPEQAREAYEEALGISKSLGDKRAQGVDLDHLGALALVQGRFDDALANYREALALFQAAGEHASAAVAQHNVARVLSEAKRWGEADSEMREAARARSGLGDHAGAAQSWTQLASNAAEAGSRAAATDCLREALASARASGDPVLLRHQQAVLADHLRADEDGLDEALGLLREAIDGISIESFSPDVWSIYAILADILGEADDPETKSRAAGYYHVQQFGPQLQATLTGIGEQASLARALLLARFGRCFLIGGRPDLASTFLQETLATAAKLPDTADARNLTSATELEFGGMIAAAGQHETAKPFVAAALARARETGELRVEAAALKQMSELAAAAGDSAEAETHARAAIAIFDALGESTAAAELRGRLGDAAAAPSETKPAPAEGIALELFEETSVDCVFDTDLMIDLFRGSRRTALTETAPALDPQLIGTLAPQARVYAFPDGTIRFALPLAEPNFEQQPECVLISKSRIEVAVAGETALVWQLVRALDGSRTVGAILADIDEQHRDAAARILAALAQAGVVDVSGRPYGRLLHAMTKKGVLPGGGLESDRVLDLVTDGNYRVFPEAEQIALSQEVPERLGAFHSLTRRRRSRRDYAGGSIQAADFAALLNTACGVTGAMPWEDREVKLRVYPSSGALYAVEIYPIVLSVEDLETGIYHYTPNAHALDAVRPDAQLSRLIGAMLPVEREMVAGASAMICLVGRFRRHEHKYGEGGYRMMVAEAGHISQNLVLAATALGLTARPFGGVMDRLFNEELGLDETEEQFLLSVLVGHSASGAETPAS
jgi:SagB-type dehydrogenase family enzyme